MEPKRKTLTLEVTTTMTNRELAKLRGVTMGQLSPAGYSITGGPAITIIQIGVNTIKPAKKDTTIRRR